jgi:hypothetical protein
MPHFYFAGRKQLKTFPLRLEGFVPRPFKPYKNGDAPIVGRERLKTFPPLSFFVSKTASSRKCVFLLASHFCIPRENLRMTAFSCGAFTATLLLEDARLDVVS